MAPKRTGRVLRSAIPPPVVVGVARSSGSGPAIRPTRPPSYSLWPAAAEAEAAVRPNGSGPLTARTAALSSPVAAMGTSGAPAALVAPVTAPAQVQVVAARALVRAAREAPTTGAVAAVAAGETAATARGVVLPAVVMAETVTDRALVAVGPVEAPVAVAEVAVTAAVVAA